MKALFIHKTWATGVLSLFLALLAVELSCLRHSICQLSKTVWQENGAVNSKFEESCPISTIYFCIPKQHGKKFT
jgi:hypothetical protein